MTLKCRCKIFKRKYSCCYQFEPVEINDMRDSCFLRDNWEHGINLLNEIVLGALSSCVHSSAKQTKNHKRTNNHATLRLKGKRVCKDMFIFAYAFSIKRYDLIRGQLNSTGVDLKFNGHCKKQNNKVFLKIKFPQS